MNAKDGWTGADEWKLLTRYFPPGWEAAAGSLGALRRCRRVRDPACLLRCLLVHLADGCSLKEAATRIRAAGWAEISSVALHKRLRAAGHWLRWLAEQLWRQARPAPPVRGRRVRAVDATTVSEPGRTGSVWRLHYAINLANLQCDHFQVAGTEIGERFQGVPIEAGDLLLADRIYGTPTGVEHVHAAGGDVVVRINLRMLPLFTVGDRRISILNRLRTLRVGQVKSWPAWVNTRSGSIEGRLVAVKRSLAATRRARRQLRRRANRQQRRISQDSWEAEHYVFVWTSLSEEEYPPQAIMELYRLRWQIELSFKRMKSLMGLGQLPKHNDDSARAWLHGKLFVALLVERLIDEASVFSPWGYALESPP